MSAMKLIYTLLHPLGVVKQFTLWGDSGVVHVLRRRRRRVKVNCFLKQRSHSVPNTWQLAGLNVVQRH